FGSGNRIVVGSAAPEIRRIMSTLSKTLTAHQMESRRALLAEQLRQAAEAPATIPLSFAQQRLWFLDQLEPNSPLYNVPTIVRMTGTLDVAAWQQSLAQLVERHEILRTRFVCT